MKTNKTEVKSESRKIDEAIANKLGFTKVGGDVWLSKDRTKTFLVSSFKPTTEIYWFMLVLDMLAKAGYESSLTFIKDSIEFSVLGDRCVDGFSCDSEVGHEEKLSINVLNVDHEPDLENCVMFRAMKLMVDAEPTDLEHTKKG